MGNKIKKEEKKCEHKRTTVKDFLKDCHELFCGKFMTKFNNLKIFYPKELGKDFENIKICSKCLHLFVKNEKNEDEEIVFFIEDCPMYL